MNELLLFRLATGEQLTPCKERKAACTKMGWSFLFAKILDKLSPVQKDHAEPASFLDAAALESSDIRNLEAN